MRGAPLCSLLSGPTEGMCQPIVDILRRSTLSLTALRPCSTVLITLSAAAVLDLYQFGEVAGCAARADTQIATGQVFPICESGNLFRRRSMRSRAAYAGDDGPAEMTKT